MKIIKVISSKPITGAYRSIIEDRLSWGETKAVQFNYIIDHSVHGGIVIDDGERVFDGTTVDNLKLIGRSRTVKIISAIKLTEKQKNRIEAKYHKQDMPVSFVYSVDKSLLGGIKIIDGGDMYDGSVASRLADIKKALK